MMNIVKGCINLLVFLIEAIIVRYLMIWFSDDPSIPLDKAILYIVLVEIAFSPYVNVAKEKHSFFSSNEDKIEKNNENKKDDPT